LGSRAANTPGGRDLSSVDIGTVRGRDHRGRVRWASMSRLHSEPDRAAGRSGELARDG